MSTKQTITRKGTFDVMHRVMNERMKCYHCHGHTYLYELVFGFSSLEEIGYAVDFKEIKRVACQWIDDKLDHGAILNCKDEILIKAVNDLGTKLWLMTLNGQGNYCNPSVENIAKEVYLAIEILFEKYLHLWIESIRLYETPNCFTDCFKESISEKERNNFNTANRYLLEQYREEKGVIEYDNRKVYS
jgi:6-pyruvoyltetrahydropterin/6-carboxytetrahydropterin synthase